MWQKLFTDIFKNKEAIVLRDYLALERTKLANERTLLAYTRTSLYMILGGIAFLQLKDFNSISWLGYMTIILSIVFILIGIFRYIQIKKRLKKYYKHSIEPKTDSEKAP
ncbi:MAG: DUF202 domain-containing protein [Prolixibacteraceae bacterium]|nr:DUF202 domain-containing protein [Prolixibacteraceae bacterium]MBN2649612.1 DUF202 domain-containing protein [Prolixibacteraceae bacterium]